MLRRYPRYNVNLKHRPRAPRSQYKPFHTSPSRRLFGISFPTPSNEPLAGTAVDGSVPFLFILQVIIGLPTALWVYKCLMLVAFQRKIVYLPSVPPGTRNESLSDDERTKERDSSLNGLDWRAIETESSVPTRLLRRQTRLKGIELRWKPVVSKTVSSAIPAKPGPKVVVVYLQGNAGTPLLRIPLFRQLLRPDMSRTAHSKSSMASSPLDDLAVIAFAPRSFWLSTRTTPTESSVLADYRAALEYARERHGPTARYVLYGHSLGGAASVLLLDKLPSPPFNSRRAPDSISRPHSDTAEPRIAGLILENPLPSIPYMVKALYPQKWLPYHYLGFAAFDRWDAIGRLRSLANDRRSKAAEKVVPSLWIRSGRDEIIPTGEEDGVKEMYESWKKVAEGDQALNGRDGRNARWVDVDGALHDTAYLERKWRDEVRSFLVDVASQQDGEIEKH